MVAECLEMQHTQLRCLVLDLIPYLGFDFHSLCKVIKLSETIKFLKCILLFPYYTE